MKFISIFLHIFNTFILALSYKTSTWLVNRKSLILSTPEHQFRKWNCLNTFFIKRVWCRKKLHLQLDNSLKTKVSGWSFPLRISLVNVNTSAENSGFCSFFLNIIHEKLHFLCSVRSIKTLEPCQTTVILTTGYPSPSS